MKLDAGGVEKVWRYLKFSRFVWMLQKKQLWLSRADVLGDPWEITLAGEQLAHMIAHAPMTTLPLPDVMPETARQRAERIIPMWRRTTFINCWSASDHESHALWRIYCGAEGVAIQTTSAKLRGSIGGLPLLKVSYETPGSRKQTPACLDLATKKRPMFWYEREVRIIDYKEGTNPDQEIRGYGLDWQPEQNVESIRVHPEADNSFMETVLDAVEHYAPALKDRVTRSDMSEPPPF
ncbi:MAG TPA: hypothetical protein VKR43_19670 [Bryobacteraceae bacterium]|nr:hypothetical protein [Bryobacteraceae bacterium]